MTFCEEPVDPSRVGGVILAGGKRGVETQFAWAQVNKPCVKGMTAVTAAQKAKNVHVEKFVDHHNSKFDDIVETPAEDVLRQASRRVPILIPNP